MLTVRERGDFFAHECLLYCIVVHCRNLPKMDMFGTCDPYVILELLPDSFNHKNSREKQTKVKEGTYHPEYNETLQW